MERIDKYISSLTNRLQIDRELRMDIMNELKSHLEDKVSENMSSGMSEEESIEEAIRQFGSQEELRNQIWQANIRRLRLRSIIRWALRVTLGPAAIIFTIFYFCGFLLTAFNVNVFSNMGDFTKRQGALISALRTRQQRNLTYDERFILNEDAESIVEKFPDNPVYCANDILIYLFEKQAKPEKMNCFIIHCGVINTKHFLMKISKTMPGY